MNYGEKMALKKEQVRLVALDIDGVISKGKGDNFNGRIISILSEMNRKAFHDSSFPPVTVITGRPATYVEAFLQVIHGFAPAIYEHGTGIYSPAEYSFRPHPELDFAEDIELLKTIINHDFVRPGIARMQGGKDFSLSLFSTDREMNRRLKDMIIEKAGKICGRFDFIYSSDSLNIIPSGFHKGKGIRLLADVSGVPLSAILGVGDSSVDVPFLEKTGYSAAPFNAGPDVKKAVGYCSEKYYDEGLEDILSHFGLLP